MPGVENQVENCEKGQSEHNIPSGAGQSFHLVSILKAIPEQSAPLYRRPVITSGEGQLEELVYTGTPKLIWLFTYPVRDFPLAVKGIARVTVLSVLVDALFRLPDKSITTPVKRVAITVPDVVIPLIAAFQVTLSVVVNIMVFVPPAVLPTKEISQALNEAGLIALLNIMVKLMGGV